MARIGDGGDLLKCSFCGKSQKQVKKLIAGPGVYICDECIDLCNEIIEEELADADDVKLDELPKPAEIREFYVVGVSQFLFDDLVAQVYAFIADVYAWARNEFLDLLLTLSAERALQQVTAVSNARHVVRSYFPVRTK